MKKRMKYAESFETVERERERERERATLYATAKQYINNLIEIIKGENAFIIDGIKGRLL